MRTHTKTHIVLIIRTYSNTHSNCPQGPQIAESSNNAVNAGERVSKEYQQLIEKLWPTLQNQNTILGIKVGTHTHTHTHKHTHTHNWKYF